jgi:hypothetical protein
MEKIIKLILSQLRNNEYYQFMTDVKNAIEVATPAALNLDSVYPEFTTAIEAMNKALLVDQGSVKTEELIALDVLRDRTWSAIYAQVRATLICPVEKEVESAKRLKRVFDLYGNVRTMSYNEETAVVTNLIEDLESEENAAHCNTVGVNKWLNALKQQNTDFVALLDARNVELANKESGDVKAARDGIDPAYEKIVKRANALVELEMASPELEAFIRELNQRIKYYKETLAARAGRKAEEEENTPEEPV